MTVFYMTLLYMTVFYMTLFYVTLFYVTVFRVLRDLVLRDHVLHDRDLHHRVLHYFVLHDLVLHYLVLHYFVLHETEQIVVNPCTKHIQVHYFLNCIIFFWFTRNMINLGGFLQNIAFRKGNSSSEYTINETNVITFLWEIISGTTTKKTL